MKYSSCFSKLPLLLALLILMLPAAALSQIEPQEREEPLEIRPEIEGREGPLSRERIVPGEEVEEPVPGDRASLGPVKKMRVDELEREFRARTDRDTTLVEKNIEQEAFVRDSGIKF